MKCRIKKKNPKDEELEKWRKERKKVIEDKGNEEEKSKRRRKRRKKWSHRMEGKRQPCVGS